MAQTAKISIVSWWIFALMSLFLWYRNLSYDRSVSIYFFILSLIQLIEYGVYSGGDPQQAGTALYIILWLQCLVLAIGVFVFIKSYDDIYQTTTKNIIKTISSWYLIIYSAVFLIALVSMFASNNSYSINIRDDGNIEWMSNGSEILGNWNWLYIIGMIVPFILLFGFFGWADIGIACIILYIILSALYVGYFYNPYEFNSMWCYYALIIVFLVWIFGMFSG